MPTAEDLQRDPRWPRLFALVAEGQYNAVAAREAQKLARPVASDWACTADDVLQVATERLRLRRRS